MTAVSCISVWPRNVYFIVQVWSLFSKKLFFLRKAKFVSKHITGSTEGSIVYCSSECGYQYRSGIA